MAEHQMEWGALTCHDKWIFVRLHKGTATQDPYLTYSTVEKQTENTKPFRALLGMVLAAVRGIDVKCHANMEMPLTVIADGPGKQNGQIQTDSSYDLENDGSSAERGSRLETQLLRQSRQHDQLSPAILVS